MPTTRELRPRKPKLTFSSTPDIKGNDSWMLRFPPEILVLIVQWVAKFNTSPYPLTRTSSDRESLRHLSLCNKTLRGACHSAGLFSRLTPPETKIYLSTDLEKLLGGIPWRLTSLGIDLGNPDVWEICAYVMGRFPDLDGIVLSRSPKKTKERFINSDIASKFEAFKGTSVTLKGASFNQYQSGILYHLNRSNVVNFSSIESQFICHGSESWGKVEPLFPKLQSFLFIGLAKFTRGFIHEFYDQGNLFGGLFWNPPDLRYFEFTSGSTPRLLKDRRREANQMVCGKSCDTYWNKRTRGGILCYLRIFAYRSLEVFIDADGLSGPFLDHGKYVFWGRDCKPFEKMKLLVFRCENPENLISFAGDSHDCTVEYVFGTGVESPEALREHSIWYHISNLYAFFSDCDCILIETMVGSGKFQEGVWQFASERIMNQSYCLLGKVGTLRYFVIGNNVDGYSGIERDFSSEIESDEIGRPTWRYHFMNGRESKEVILERSG